MIVVVSFRSCHRRGYLPVYLSAFASRKDTLRQQEIDFEGKSSVNSDLLGRTLDTSRHDGTLSDAMGDGVNIAARLEGIAKPGAICLSEDAYRQVKGRLDLEVTDLGPTQLKNIAEPIRVYSLQVGVPARSRETGGTRDARSAHAAEEALRARGARRRARRAAGGDRGRRVVVPRREPPSGRRLERASAAYGPTSFPRRAALRQSHAAIRRRTTSPTHSPMN